MPEFMFSVRSFMSRQKNGQACFELELFVYHPNRGFTPRASAAGRRCGKRVTRHRLEPKCARIGGGGRDWRPQFRANFTGLSLFGGEPTH